jgi:type IV secretion system protein VirB6
MAGACPAPGPEDPLVRSLLGVVDCNVRELVHSGYMAIFQPTSALSGLLTALLTIYVAILGYRLLIGRSQLTVSDFALNAVKLGAVIALATQWDTYQTLVYGFLFQGPQQLAGTMLGAVQPDSSIFHGDVFDGLQTAFDDLSGFGAGYASHAPAAASPLLGGAGFGAFLLTSSASILLLSSLGVLLVAKIVLGLLLAVGPIFIALLLFESTRGVFEGWLRASLAFAFAPLTATLMLGVALTMLEPSLLQMENLQKQHIYTLGPVYAVMTLILVFAGVSAGALIAGGMIATGFRLPRLRNAAATTTSAAQSRTDVSLVNQSRASRVAAAATALDRRDTTSMVSEIRSSERRTERTGLAERGVRLAPEPARLGQQSRRTATPRTGRTAAPRPDATSSNASSAR